MSALADLLAPDNQDASPSLANPSLSATAEDTTHDLAHPGQREGATARNRALASGLAHDTYEGLDRYRAAYTGERPVAHNAEGMVADTDVQGQFNTATNLALGGRGVAGAVPSLAKGAEGAATTFIGRKGGERLGKGLELQVAEGLYKQGFPIEDIRKQTGWGFGPRGEHDWQYEVSDHDMDFRPGTFVANPGGGLKNQHPTLGQTVQHDKFFEAYPEAANLWMRASVDPLRPPGGVFDSRMNRIETSGMDAREAREILAHELQHLADEYEKKAGGSNPRWTRQVMETDVLPRLAPEAQAAYRALSENEKQRMAYRRYRHDAGEVNAEITRNRLDLTPEQRLAREPMLDRPKDIDPDLITLGRASAGYGGPVKAEMAIKGYHGSPHDFDKFDASKAGSTTDPGALGRAIYFSDDERVSATSPHRYEADLDVSNPLNLEMPDFKTRKVDVVSKALGIDPPKNRDEMAAWSQKVTDLARARGHDSVILDNSPTGYNGREIAVFDDKVVEILRKYGVAGLAMLPPAVQATLLDGGQGKP